MALGYYEQYLEMIADEVNVKQIVLYQQRYADPETGDDLDVTVTYDSDTKRLIVTRGEEEVDAPQTVNIACKRFFANPLNHLEPSRSIA
jgi:hypothetical protein